MKQRIGFCISVIFFTVSCQNEIDKNGIYQYSITSALMEGAYDGKKTFDQLKVQGDFGLGTFNGLDGEMVALDGEFYQIEELGKVNKCDMHLKSPYLILTHFNPQNEFEINQPLNLQQVQELIDQNISKNGLYAIKIQGSFKNIQTRSVKKQDKPYVKLFEAVRDQHYFYYEEIKGTLVGFYLPSYFSGISIPGYHFHFISDDKTKGGHVRSFTADQLLVEIQESKDFKLEIAETEFFFNKEMDKNNTSTLLNIEN